MTEKYSFFDHIDGDREYTAADFADYFRQVLTNGILNGGTNLQVYCAGTDRVARIKLGVAWLEGYFCRLADTEVELQLAEAHSTYDRIDRIVLRLDRNPEARSFKAFVLTGESAMEPVPPELTRDDLVYEISLAKILVVHNTSTVPAVNVTDERLNTAVCGLVNSRIQADTTEIFNQFEAWYQLRTAEFEAEWSDWLTTQQQGGCATVADLSAHTNDPAPHAGYYTKEQVDILIAAAKKFQA